MPVMKNYHIIVLVISLIVILGVFPPFQNVSHRNRESMNVVLAQQLSYSDHNPNKLANSDYGKGWAVSAIMATQAWQRTTGRPDIIIAVLDTGIDETHQDLNGQVIQRVDFSGSGTTDDIYEHGTHVAGIIAAVHNDVGILGMASNCRLLNVKVADNGGWCDSSSISQGIRWAVDHGAAVINISLYTFKPSIELEDSVNYAWNNGAIVVVSSGNGVGSQVVYPAYYRNCIAVAATNIDDTVMSWSGEAEWVHVSAPGKNIFSTTPHDTYQYKSGTSMASAYVSGLAGLLFSIGHTTNEKIRWAIENSCDTTNVKAIGRINARNAMDIILDDETR